MVRNLNLLVINVSPVVILDIYLQYENNKKKNGRALNATLSDIQSEQQKENNLEDGETNRAFTVKAIVHSNLFETNLDEDDYRVTSSFLLDKHSAYSF